MCSVAVAGTYWFEVAAVCPHEADAVSSYLAVVVLRVVQLERENMVTLTETAPGTERTPDLIDTAPVSDVTSYIKTWQAWRADHSCTKPNL